MITISNLSSVARNYKYIIFRIVDGVNWYWGANDDVTKCSEICAQLGANARVVESINVA